MKHISAIASFALLTAAADVVGAQAAGYDADTPNYLAAEAYGGGGVSSGKADIVFADDPIRAQTLYTQVAALGHVYATRNLIHHFAEPPGETKVTTKGGIGEDQ